MAGYSLIEHSKRGEVTVVRLANPETQQRLVTSELGDELIDLIQRERPEKLLIDFERVSYCSSEVIGGLIRAWKQVSANGGQTKFCSIHGDIYKVLEVSQLLRIFEIYPSAEEAIAAF